MNPKLYVIWPREPGEGARPEATKPVDLKQERCRLWTRFRPTPKSVCGRMARDTTNSVRDTSAYGEL